MARNLRWAEAYSWLISEYSSSVTVTEWDVSIYCHDADNAEDLAAELGLPVKDMSEHAPQQRWWDGTHDGVTVKVAGFVRGEP